MPRRSFDALLQAMGAASVLSDVDHYARAAYEHRATGAGGVAAYLS
jgi:hypothetical protein